MLTHDTDGDSRPSGRDLLAGTVLVLTVAVSFVGDFFFETQWTNPWWYLFELVVVGAGLSCLLWVLSTVGTRDE